MRAITVRQPWAHLIVTGAKLVEHRSWRTHHRGALLIHAGQEIDQDGPEIKPAGARRHYRRGRTRRRIRARRPVWLAAREPAAVQAAGRMSGALVALAATASRARAIAVTGGDDLTYWSEVTAWGMMAAPPSGGTRSTPHARPALRRALVCLLSPVADMVRCTPWAAMGHGTKSLRDSGVHSLAAEH